MVISILGLPVLILLVYFITRLIVRAGLGVSLSILLAAGLFTGGFVARNTVGLEKHLQLPDGTLAIHVAVAAACGIAGYLIVAGIQELRRLKAANAQGRPRR